MSKQKIIHQRLLRLHRMMVEFRAMNTQLVADGASFFTDKQCRDALDCCRSHIQAFSFDVKAEELEQAITDLSDDLDSHRFGAFSSEDAANSLKGSFFRLGNDLAKAQRALVDLVQE
jgi:hypothetical protein